ncbi:MAG: DUF4911 domain-containing protein [Desulfomonilia bacterium]
MAFRRISATLPRNEIFYVKFILEGYDGIGTVTTEDTKAARIRITYPEEQENTLHRLMGTFLKERIVKEVRKV